VLTQCNRILECDIFIPPFDRLHEMWPKPISHWRPACGTIRWCIDPRTTAVRKLFNLWSNSVEQKSFREIYNGEYKKSSFYGTGRFITMLTKSLPPTSILCHQNQIHTTTWNSFRINFISSYHLHQGLPNDLSSLKVFVLKFILI
jgi:hypothetical protein